MEQSQKQRIVERLSSVIKRMGSLNKAANSLQGVSSATLSQMINGNWELIKSEMWRNVASQIDLKNDGWKLVETKDYKVLSNILADAQENALVLAITGAAGTGKTFTIKNYTDSHKEVYFLQCNEYWNRKMFLCELLQSMGRDSSGYTVGEMMSEAVRILKTQEHPIIIMDEADKLTDQVLYFFITLYNQLEDHCGIILAATNHLEKRIIKGVKNNKKGYSEIYSRIGRKFVKMSGISYADISMVCQHNGVTDPEIIKVIVQDSECDLRRVKRKIHATKPLV